MSMVKATHLILFHAGQQKLLYKHHLIMLLLNHQKHEHWQLSRALKPV